MLILLLLFSAITSISGYKVGVDYHATGSDFTGTAFLVDYHHSHVRSMVLNQLQGMADHGADFISTRIWFVLNPGQTHRERYRATFPMSHQEKMNLHQFAKDVAVLRSASRVQRLQLDIGMMWLGNADYTVGNPSTGLGYSNLTTREFTSRVEQSIDSVLEAVRNVTRPDGVRVVETLYFDYEVMIGAKPNQDWFLTTHYPTFSRKVAAAGFTPSVYFLAEANEHHLLPLDYIDSKYADLNGHRSMFWIYRSLKLFVDHNLPIPKRIDFSCYINRVAASYRTLVTRILDDADATLSKLGAPQSYGIAETYYFPDSVQRREYGQAFALAAASNPRLDRLSFWTTPDGGGAGVHIGYPFEINNFRLVP